MQLEQEDRLISEDVEKFTDYFNSFYGENGMYLYRDTGSEDILIAIKLLLADQPDYVLTGDSVDREIISNYIFSRVDLEYIYG